jgi:hypothetical protein
LVCFLLRFPEPQQTFEVIVFWKKNKKFLPKLCEGGLEEVGLVTKA